MGVIELGRFTDIDAQILIGRLRAEGIGAFPAPSSTTLQGGGMMWTSILIDDADLDEARRIATEDLSEE